MPTPTPTPLVLERFATQAFSILRPANWPADTRDPTLTVFRHPRGRGSISIFEEPVPAGVPAGEYQNAKLALLRSELTGYNEASRGARPDGALLVEASYLRNDLTYHALVHVVARYGKGYTVVASAQQDDFGAVAAALRAAVDSFTAVGSGK